MITKDAYYLFHRGTVALSNAEANGMRIDVPYCKAKREELAKKIDDLEKEFKDTKLAKKWKGIFGGKTNFNSNHQLSKLLFKVMGVEPIKYTQSGAPSTDVDSLKELDVPGLELIVESRRWRKVKDTYIEGLLREQVDGILHPFFNLHLARTFRSCVAKGTKVLVCRDFEEFPDGVPIEQVRKGDYVYCFDDNLKPTIRKVLWAGKTGNREVVRVHYTAPGGGGRGYLDVTPEHKIRLIDGSYVPAEKLAGDVDFRKPSESKHLPKIRSLSCKRVGDTLRFTGHLKHGNGLLEHHLIYEYFKGPLEEGEIIHHKNGRHLDHKLENLEKTNLSRHSRFHSENVSDRIRRIRIETLRQNRGKIKYKKGAEHPRSLNLSKFSCLRELARVKGQISKTQYSFTTFKNYVQFYGIDPFIVRLRYDKSGKYISKGRLERMSKLGRTKVSEILGIGYERLLRLYSFYGISTDRKWANQFGEFKPGNHVITEVEYINKKVDVYDIEVEDFHNFFANEICVHNSSDHINFQNLPKRDKEAMKIVKKAIYARKGHQLIEADYSGIEVRVSACCHRDPMMITYIKDKSTDMHRDMCMQIYILNEDEWTKDTRFYAKNGFVFPEFYGDYYKNCAGSMWKAIETAKLKTKAGVPLKKHLRRKGIRNYQDFEDHMQKVEDHFWGKRFAVYQAWKDEQWEKYKKRGYIDMYTGFRCSGVMSKNEVNNYPIQGPAFHCLLWSFAELDGQLSREGWDSRLIGQIHDSMVIDVEPGELEDLKGLIKEITCERLPKYWDWIIVPLEIDIDMAGVDEPWSEMKGD